MIEIFKTNAEGRLDALPEEMLSAEGFSPKDCWINLVNPSDKEVATISALVGVEEDVLKTPLDDEERSRYENEDDYSLVLVDIPVIEEEAAYYSYFTIPLGAVIKDDCMITVCLKDTAVMLKGDAVKSFTMMFLQNWNITERGQESYERYLEHFEDGCPAAARAPTPGWAA